MNKLIKKCQAGSAINNGINSSYKRYLKRRAVNDMIEGSGGFADSIDDYLNPTTGENIFSLSLYNWLLQNNGFNSKGKLRHGALRRMNKHLNNPEYQSMFGGIYGALPSTSTFDTSSFLTDRDDIKLNYNFTPQSVTDSYIANLRKPWTEVTATPPVLNPYTTDAGPVVAPGTQLEITAETPITPVTRTFTLKSVNKATANATAQAQKATTKQASTKDKEYLLALEKQRVLFQNQAKANQRIANFSNQFNLLNGHSFISGSKKNKNGDMFYTSNKFGPMAFFNNGRVRIGNDMYDYSVEDRNWLAGDLITIKTPNGNITMSNGDNAYYVNGTPLYNTPIFKQIEAMKSNKK